jgi:Ca2+-binding RTX toxin-like protein
MRALLAVIGILVASVTAASATPPLDLFEESGLRMEVTRAESPNGFGPPVELTAIGDLNGDGLRDLAVQPPGPDFGGDESAVYVALGRAGLRAGPATIALDDVLRIVAESGRSIQLAERVGDVNGDGFDDVAVTTRLRGSFTPGDARLAVVFGGASPTDVDLAQLGDRGFTIDGVTAHGGVGDVDRDGHDDLGVEADRGPGVVFGAADGYEGALAIELADDERTATVTAAGDVNGDGSGDVLVGIVTLSGLPTKAGAALAVIFGENLRGQTVDVHNLGSRGFRVRDADGGGDAGARGVGDVNADGFDDVAYDHVIMILGAASSEDVHAGSLGGRGYRLEPPENVRAGIDIAPAGDLNADGRADMLIGVAAGENRGTFRQVGEAYVVFGGDSTNLTLRTLGGPGDNPRGYEMRGVPGDRAGNSVAVPGDMDGDGQSELALVAHTCTGVRNVDFGPSFDTMPLVYLPDANARSQNRGRSTDGPDTLAATPGEVVLRGRGGPDDLAGDDDANCVFGDEGRDTLAGFAAGDVLFGDTGRDALAGGQGGDLVDGGPDADEVDGGDDADALSGRSGTDEIDGGAGGDNLLGGTADDRVQGGAGADSLYGGQAADVILAGDGDDFLYGDKGDDTIRGGAGSDVVRGGHGDDTIDVVDGERDTVDCHTGRDTVRADTFDRIVNGSPRRHADAECETVVRVESGA